MKFVEFKESLKAYTVFSIHEIEKIDNRFHRRRLNDWQEKGYIKKVIKGYYVFSDLDLNENILFEIANKIHRPAYVSLEMVLSYYHLIPESVYAITSVSSRRPSRYETPLADFIYRKIKPGLYFGYKLVKSNGGWFKIARLEKAILDYLYINPHLTTPEDFESLRLNVSIFRAQIDKQRLCVYLDKFSQKKLAKRINLLLDFIQNA